jgi:hypothetical protein
MNEKQSKMLAITCAVLFILFIAYKRAQAAQVVPNVQTDVPAATGTTPGIPPDYWYMNGANQPIATPGNTDVSISIDPWSTLNQDYMPLFGFVGVSTTAYQ